MTARQQLQEAEAALAAYAGGAIAALVVSAVVVLLAIGVMQ